MHENVLALATASNVAVNTLSHGQFLLFALLGEILGTMILIIFGNGVVASVSFKKMFAHNTRANWVLITAAWALAVFLGVLVADQFGAPGYLNPAVIVMDLIKGQKEVGVPKFLTNYVAADATANVLNAGEMILLLVGTFIGAILGQVILNIINWNHIKENPAAALKGSSCTGPAHENKWVHNFLYEFLGTILLLVAVLVAGKQTGFAGLTIVVAAVTTIGMSLGSSTGYAINPARDLGPRLVYYLTALIFKNKLIEPVKADWKYGLLVPGLAPVVAGLVMGGINAIF
ncbi:MIP/aquaporin family protein [Mycoplasma corogypsi]|uniref:MIP/aquaporin family protein n=1 Tax=Mycoplasma corogypsi TaxID=2106 RepID=UPI0038733AFD